MAPLGQGYLFVRSRARVTVDGGHSILAISDPTVTTRLGRVSTRNEIRDIGEGRSVARNADEAAIMEMLGIEPADSLNAEIPTLMPDNSPETTLADPLVPHVIIVDGANARFAPLVKYMQRTTVHGYINIKTVRRHFSKMDPGAFGSSVHAIDLVIQDALVANIIEKFTEQSVRLVKRAAYVFP